MTNIIGTAEKITESMKAGLAKMYADDGFRSYLVNRINIENLAALRAIREGKADEARDYTARLDALQKLLDKGKACYVSFERIRLQTLEQQQKHNEENDQSDEIPE